MGRRLVSGQSKWDGGSDEQRGRWWVGGCGCGCFFGLEVWPVGQGALDGKHKRLRAIRVVRVWLH